MKNGRLPAWPFFSSSYLKALPAEKKLYLKEHQKTHTACSKYTN
jgi:hypothetical protein